MNPFVFDKFIFNPTIEVTPHITISPFDLKQIPVSHDEGFIAVAEKYLNQRFNNYTICLKARHSIKSVLNSLNLKKDDEVAILTTTNNRYISSCVTNAIEEVCKWDRVINENTKVILINHEFGYPYEDAISLRKYGLPIIEDCVHSFTHSDAIGNVGDYVIYSLSKNLPIQIGSIIKNNTENPIESEIDGDCKEFILRSLAKILPDLDFIESKRKENLDYLELRFKEFGCFPLLKRPQNEVPNVFMFTLPPDICLQKLKQFMWNHGVECSVFYGMNAFFIPCHYNLDTIELDYMIDLVRYFIYNTNDF